MIYSKWLGREILPSHFFYDEADEIVVVVGGVTETIAEEREKWFQLVIIMKYGGLRCVTERYPPPYILLTLRTIDYII